jgi:hypothetical protein
MKSQTPNTKLRDFGVRCQVSGARKKEHKCKISNLNTET